MFKKFKKTKMVFGGMAVGAIAIFPVATSLNNAQKAPQEDYDSPIVNTGTPDPIKATFHNKEGSPISTHDWVIDTSGIGYNNFKSRAATDELFSYKKVPLNDLYTDPDSGKGLGNIYEEEYQPIQKASAINTYFSEKGWNFGDVGKFVSESGRENLFKTLNKDLATKAVKGQRYNFAVPNRVINLAGSISAGKTKQSDLPSTPITADTAHPYSYKVASLKASEIKTDKKVILDYMYRENATSAIKKVQIVFNGTDKLSNDGNSIQDLINEGSIFLRTMNDKLTPDDKEIKDGFNLNNAGLTIAREGKNINVYSSLQSTTAKSAVMLDPKTDDELDADVSVGDLNGIYKDGGCVVPSSAPNALSSFKEFALTGKWTDETGYTWKDTTSAVDTSKISFYMKAGTSLSAKVEYVGLKPEDDLGGLDSITIKATDTTVEMNPTGSIQIDSTKFEDGAESFEVVSHPITAVPTTYGTWYEVTIHVAKNSGRKFFIGENSKSVELPWTLDDTTSLTDVLFREPWTKDYAPDTSKEVILNLPFQKHINQNNVSTDVLKQVYGSWVKPTSWITNKAITNLLNINRDQSPDDTNPWRVNGGLFTYNGLNEVNGVADIKNPKIITMGKWTKMSDVINALNNYHNNLMDAEAKYLKIDTQLLRDIYEPATAEKFASDVATNLQQTPAIWKQIQTEIADVVPILGLSKNDYDVAIEAFHKHPDTYKGTVDFKTLETTYGVDEIEKIKPDDKNSPHPELLGETTVAQFIAKDVEKLIPALFDQEWSRFVSKMKEPQAVKFDNFLKYTYPKAVQVIDKDAIKKGELVIDGSGHAKAMTAAEFAKYTLKDGETVIDFSDLSSDQVKTTPASTGRKLIEDLYSVLYKTGMYKGFITDPALRETFVNLMNHDTSTAGEKFPLWGATAYEVSGKNIVTAKMDILEDIVEGLENNNGGMTSDATATSDDQSDDPGIGGGSFSTFLANPSVETLDIAQRMQQLVEELSDGNPESQTYVWTGANIAHSSLLARMIIANNVTAVTDYLEKATKANKDPMLVKRYDAFRSAIATSRGIAQLGPKLKMYDIQKFIDGLSNDADETANIMEQMLQVDPVRVLIPDTSASKTTEILRDSGGKVIFGLIVAAGVILALIGGILLFLSFTKRLVVNGKTWSVKLIVMRVAIIAILVVGVYILAAGTILPGHAALTSVLKV